MDDAPMQLIQCAYLWRGKTFFTVSKNNPQLLQGELVDTILANLVGFGLLERAGRRMLLTKH